MKEHRKSTNFGRIYLTKKDLEDLVNLINEGAEKLEGSTFFTIETKIADVSISEDNLETFFLHKELISDIEEIHIYLNHKSETTGPRNIFLNFGNYSNNISVSGTDQTWVLGKHKQLLDYILTKRTRMSFFTASIATGFKGAFSILILYSIVFAFLFLYKKGMSWIGLFVVLCPLFLMFTYLSLGKIKNTSVVLKDKTSFWKKNEVAISLIISFLTLLATVILGIIQL